ncbi:hypothetical protein EVAR_62879_1 [Eumeta japonica]|uniref:Uncharacterized protein n=1 Tax=Eumeta variegata TaxID=151549 RepID=A0A4C1Z406_EUMVA|nr:hypothetical protein EVAR_62879_1 [Eumeta japonica]
MEVDRPYDARYSEKMEQGSDQSGTRSVDCKSNPDLRYAKLPPSTSRRLSMVNAEISPDKYTSSNSNPGLKGRLKGLNFKPSTLVQCGLEAVNQSRHQCNDNVRLYVLLLLTSTTTLNLLRPHGKRKQL